MQLIKTRLIAAIGGLLIIFSCSVASAQTSDPDWVQYVGAREIAIPALVVNVADYGARGDGTTMNTAAIQRAIDTCAARGGGQVIFPTGSFLTGSIFLKSTVELHIAGDVKLLGSQSLNAYPGIWTPLAGANMLRPAARIHLIGSK